MSIGLGFFCSTSDNKLSTNHKLRLASLNKENLFRVFSRNLHDFIELLKISNMMGLTIFRLGSNFIPFASHPMFNREWLTSIGEILRDKSGIIKSYGVRITMHPGQYVVLNSSNPLIVERSLKELEYHFWVLDTIGLGSDSIVVVHVGGIYGDKQRAIRNLYSVLEENRWLLRRLALENDERYYSVSDVIEICESFGIPVVYDHFHHKLNPSRFSIDRLIDTWKGKPLEIHISSGNPTSRRRGEHGDFVNIEDFVEAISIFPDDVVLDIVVEAKKKELAIAELIRELRVKQPWLLEKLRRPQIVDLLSSADILDIIRREISARHSDN